MNSNGARAAARIANTPTARGSTTCYAVAILIVGALTRLLLRPGLYGSDDIVYIVQAMEEARGIWRPPTDLINTRFGATVPIAAFNRLFGNSTFALTAWSLTCSLAEVLVTFLFARSAFGLRAAIVAGLLMALTPMHLVIGTLALADATLAFAITGAFVAFHFAQESRHKRYYVLAGACMALAWYTKPIAAVPFLCALAFCAAARQRPRPEWAIAAIVFVAGVLLEWGLLAIAFGDPLLSVKLNFSGVTRNFIDTDAPWGVHSPWFYLHQLFVDGRAMWLLPHLAVVGGLVCYASRGERSDAWQFAVWWAVALLGVFSFFVYSLHPLKFIPKQPNYALIFVAPLAVLAGAGIDRMTRRMRWLALVAYAAPALVLAAIEEKAIAYKFARIQQTLAFALEHSDRPVFASEQVMNVARLESLRTGAVADMRPIRNLLSRDVAAAMPAIWLAIDPSTPELAKGGAGQQLRRDLETCATKEAELVPSSAVPGRALVTFVAAVRSHVPALLEKQLRFTDAVISPQRVEIYSLTSRCASSLSR